MHLSKVQEAILEVVAEQGGALVDSHIISDVDEVKVGEVEAVQVCILAYPGTLHQSQLNEILRSKSTSVAVMRMEACIPKHQHSAL